MSNPLAQMWDESKGKETKFSSLADGTYQVEVETCGYGKTKAELPKIEWQLKVIEGDQKNSKHWVHRVLDTNKPNSIAQAKQDFLDLDLDATSANVTKSMEFIIGKTIEIQLKTSDQGNQFTNFKRIIETVAPILNDGLPADFKAF